MKKYALAKTKNVKNAEKLLEDISKRPITEMVGLGLIWGPPGLGKTRTMQTIAFKKGFIQLKLDSSTTQRSFILRLRDAISYRLNLSLGPSRGSSDKVFQECISYLNEASVTIVIDEIDYAFRDKKLLGTIRDIVDDAIFTNIILIGMSNAKEKLSLANAHYFDRCNFFCNFLPLNQEDTTLVCNELCDFAVPENLCKKVFERTSGNPRKIVKEIQALERTQGKNDN